MLGNVAYFFTQIRISSLASLRSTVDLKLKGKSFFTPRSLSNCTPLEGLCSGQEATTDQACEEAAAYISQIHPCKDQPPRL